MNKVLAIGDLHEPFCLDGFLDFNKSLKPRGPKEIVFIGDIVDNHYSSYHEADPDGMSAGDELEGVTGALDAKLADLASDTGVGKDLSPRQIEYLTTIRQLLENYARSRSGAAIGEEEWVNFKRQVTGGNLTVKDAIVALTSFVKLTL